MGNPHVNVDQMKQQQQMMAMRAQQMASGKQKLNFEGRQGNRKQLIGTILAIVGVLLLLFFLSYFRII